MIEFDWNGDVPTRVDMRTTKVKFFKKYLFEGMSDSSLKVNVCHLRAVDRVYQPETVQSRSMMRKTGVLCTVGDGLQDQPLT